MILDDQKPIFSIVKPPYASIFQNTFQQPWYIENRFLSERSHWFPSRYLHEVTTMKSAGWQVLNHFNLPQMMSSVQRFINGLTSTSRSFDPLLSLSNNSAKMVAFLLNTSKKDSSIWTWNAGFNKRRVSFHCDPYTNTVITFQHIFFQQLMLNTSRQQNSSPKPRFHRVIETFVDVHFTG